MLKLACLLAVALISGMYSFAAHAQAQASCADAFTSSGVRIVNSDVYDAFDKIFPFFDSQEVVSVRFSIPDRVGLPLLTVELKGRIDNLTKVNALIGGTSLILEVIPLDETQVQLFGRNQTLLSGEIPPDALNEILQQIGGPELVRERLVALGHSDMRVGTFRLKQHQSMNTVLEVIPVN